MQIGGDMIGADVTNGREEKEKERMKAYCHERRSSGWLTKGRW